jgi:hypothetical protein
MTSHEEMEADKASGGSTGHDGARFARGWCSSEAGDGPAGKQTLLGVGIEVRYAPLADSMRREPRANTGCRELVTPKLFELSRG